MIQEILMWICVVGAFAYTAFALGKAIWSAYQEKVSGCAGSCSSCSAKNDLLKNIKFKNIKPVHLINSNH